MILKIAAGPGPADVATAFGYVWVTNHHGASVSKLDPATGTTLATISVGTQPASITIGAGSVFETNYDGTVSRINPKTDQVTTIGAFPSLCGWPAVAGGAVWVYVCDVYQPYVARVDLATGRTTATIPAGTNQSSLLLADGILWMTTFPGGKVFRVDPKSGRVLQTIAVPGCPLLGAQSYASGSIWIGQMGDCPTDSGRIVRMNAKTGAVESQIPASRGSNVSISDGVYWVVDRSGKVSRLDPATLKSTDWTNLDTAIDNVAVDAGSIWAVSFDSEQLWRIATGP